MRKGILLILIQLLVLQVFAQQTTQRTQFYLNRLSINPAVAGTQEKIPLLVHVRQQWIGIDEAPTTQTFSANGYTGKNLGMGVVIFNDVAGPTRNTGISLSGAYHLQLTNNRTNNTWLSFGLSGNLYQYFFDADKLQTDEPNDIAIDRLLAEGGRLTPDVSAGVYINNDNWFLGLSALNLLQSETDIFTGDLNPNSIRRIYYLLAGYKHKLSQDFAVEPAALARYTSSGVFQGDFMLKGYYQKHYLGVSYRTSDAMAAILGLNINNIFEIGYSYDLTVSDISDYNDGTHEFTLVFNLFTPLTRDGKVEKPKEKKKKPRSIGR